MFPLALLFMIAAAIALVVNFPNHHDQSERVKAHASSIVAVVAMVFAAAVLVGVLEGTGMVTAMADAIVDVVPPGLGPWFAVITGAAEHAVHVLHEQRRLLLRRPADPVRGRRPLRHPARSRWRRRPSSGNPFT